MPGQILTLNAGSSSLKFAVFGPGMVRVAHGQVDGLGTAPRLKLTRGGTAQTTPAPGVTDPQAALALVLGALGDLTPRAVGHRVVHGGRDFGQPVRIDAGVLARLEALVPLAPLHQPHNLAAIRAVAALHPGVPQIGCFDTAFHRGHEFVNAAFGLPRALFDQGVQRYGFHGLSYDYLAGRLAEIDPARAAGRVVACHLGSGASLCALVAGRSVETTMGFTALDGLMMATRPGQLDPGVVLYLIDGLGMTTAEVTDLLYHRSGLLGLSGISSDMRVLEASDAPQAAQALACFAARVRREIAALAAGMGGLDAIVFSGGIGEHSARTRADVVAGMGWLGVEIDPARNAGGEALISPDTARVAVHVIPTDEELTIARQTRAVLAQA